MNYISLKIIIDFINNCHDLFVKKLYSAMLIIATQNFEYKINIPKIQILKMIGFNAKKNSQRYDSCISYLVNEHLLSIVNGYLYLPLSDCDTVCSSLDDISILCNIDFTTWTIDQCKKCGRIIINKCNNRIYCNSCGKYQRKTNC